MSGRWAPRASEANPRIEMNPRVMLGKPVIRETRIPIGLILRKLSEGVSETDTLARYPRLTGDDVRAALAFRGGHRRPRGSRVHR